MRLLGTITIPAGASRNNTTTAVPFLIPKGTAAIYLLASASTVFYVSNYDLATLAAPSAMAATAAGFPLVAGLAMAETVGVHMAAGYVVAAWNADAAPQTVTVWQVPG